LERESRSCPVKICSDGIVPDTCGQTAFSDPKYRCRVAKAKGAKAKGAKAVGKQQHKSCQLIPAKKNILYRTALVEHAIELSEMAARGFGQTFIDKMSAPDLYVNGFELLPALCQTVLGN
jgi:hypothetical protein